MEWIARLRDERRAGRSAQLHFKRTSRAWRRRVFRRIAWPLYAATFLIFVAEWILHGFNVHWWLGVGFGVLITLNAALRDSVPHHIERWRTGAEGERRTARRLRKLRREGWRTLHDLEGEWGNRDHVVIGPGGIFLLDSKALHGRAKVSGGIVRVTRPDNDRADYGLPKLVPSMRRAAATLSNDIKEHSGEGKWVHPVVVIWAKFDQRVVDVDGVTLLHGDELVSWLRSRPSQVAHAGYDPERTLAAIRAAERTGSERVPATAV